MSRVGPNLADVDTKPTVPLSPETLDATEVPSNCSAFDSAYLKHIGEKHSRSVALFESASKSGDLEVAAFARKGLSMLQQHQELADNLRGAIGQRVASMR